VQAQHGGCESDAGQLNSQPGASEHEVPDALLGRRECLRRRQARYGIETFIASASAGLALTWSEAIVSGVPTVLDMLRLPLVRDVLLTR
jgi:hypothetical protein